MDYTTAVKTLNGRKSKKLKGNTYLHKLEDNKIGLLYHKTYIINYYPKYCQLYTGGWNTLTTRDRLRTYGPVNVTTKNNILYIGNYNPQVNTPLFYEGIKMGYDGRILSKIKTGEEVRKRIQKLKKRVNTYLDLVEREIKKGKVTIPSGGDCWFCLGIMPENNMEHLLRHMKDKYVVPSLIVNACRESGYKDFQLPFILGVRDDYITEVNWNLKNMIRRYMLKRLIPKQ